MDCGPTCLRMVAKHYGKHFTVQTLRNRSHLTREGVSLLGISQAAEGIGFRSLGVKLSFEQLAEQAPLPAIVHWNQRHFVVVYKISKDRVYVADPGAKGLMTYRKADFLRHWQRTSQPKNEGIVLLLEPTPAFYETEEEQSRTNIQFLFQYLRPYRSLFVQLGLGLLLGSVFQLIFPFLTQAVVDIGIRTRNLQFIYIILAAHLEAGTHKH